MNSRITFKKVTKTLSKSTRFYIGKENKLIYLVLDKQYKTVSFIENDSDKLQLVIKYKNQKDRSRQIRKIILDFNNLLLDEMRLSK